jgi:hypothetical protein
MQTRLPPPSDAPPPYTRVIRRVYPYTLRPLVIVISVVGLIWATAVGVSNIQDVGDEGGEYITAINNIQCTDEMLTRRNNLSATKKINAFSVVMAIMYFVVAGLELFATGVATAVCIYRRSRDQPFVQNH